jgi:hypothetical protein
MNDYYNLFHVIDFLSKIIKNQQNTLYISVPFRVIVLLVHQIHIEIPIDF